VVVTDHDAIDWPSLPGACRPIPDTRDVFRDIPTGGVVARG
jgi:hypothetical protein